MFSDFTVIHFNRYKKHPGKCKLALKEESVKPRITEALTSYLRDIPPVDVSMHRRVHLFNANHQAGKFTLGG